MRYVYVLFLALIPAAAFAQIKLPKGIPDIVKPTVKLEIPGLDKILKAERPIAMTPDESAPGLPFLDDFDPKSPPPLSEFPYIAEQGFPLVYSGVFEHHAQSYCLHAGMYGPGKGDGYTHVPLKGPMARVIENILRNSGRYPDIPQSDVQGLIWAVLARSKIESLSPEYQAVAARLLTAKEIRDLNGGALSIIPSELREQAFSHLPPLVRQVMDAEATLRDLFSQHMPFDELERVAVLSGEPPSQEGAGEFPMGRWMLDPDGYFIRYLTERYSETRIQLYVPEAIEILADDMGRITSIADAAGNRIETEYDDSIEPAGFPGDDRARGYAFQSIRFQRPKSPGSQETIQAEWKNVGWTMIGMPSGSDTSGPGAPRYADLQTRYRQAAEHRTELDEFFRAMSKLTGRKPGYVSAADMSAIADLAGYKFALSEVVQRAPDGGDWADHLGLVSRAWMSVLASVSLQATDEGDRTFAPEQGVHVASSELSGLGVNLCRSREWGPPPKRRTPQLKPFKPEKKAAVPKRRGPQMEGQSGRSPANCQGKQAFERAQKAVGWLNKGLLAVNVVSSPAGALRDTIGYGVRDQMFGFGMDSTFSNARKISEALGGCPPRADFTEIARPEGFQPLTHPAGGDVPDGRVAALNALMYSLQSLVSTLRAGVISLDRYSGALEAGDDAWARRQAINYVEMKRQGGMGMIRVADRLDALIAELQSEGIRDITVPSETARAYQERLRTQGFSAMELAAARLVGTTDEEIEIERRSRLEADPEELGGSLITAGREAVESLRELGAYWATLPDPSFSAESERWREPPSVSPGG